MKLDKPALLLLTGVAIWICAAAVAAVAPQNARTAASPSTVDAPPAHRFAVGAVSDETPEYLPSRFVDEARAAKIEPMPPQF